MVLESRFRHQSTEVRKVRASLRDGHYRPPFLRENARTKIQYYRPEDHWSQMKVRIVYDLQLILNSRVNTQFLCRRGPNVPQDYCQV